MKYHQGMTVAEIVSVNIRNADVFKKYGIDFCCGGNIALVSICKQKWIKPYEILEELWEITIWENIKDDYSQWKIDALLAHIMQKYHTYTVEALSLLMQYSEKVAKVHGKTHPEVIKIHEQVSLLQYELIEHMSKEEKILFPYIRKLVDIRNSNTPFIRPSFWTIENPIRIMNNEHIAAGDTLKTIEQLSDAFTPPEWACNTFRALYSKLEEFQSITFEHIHLENNILFPRAILLEKEFLNT